MILAQAQQLVDYERSVRALGHRQDKVEDRLTNVEDRVSHVEARQTAMIDGGSQHMSVIAYCYWKNFDTHQVDPRRLSAFVDKARQLSKDRRYKIGKTLNQSGGYDDTFHLDVLNEIFVD